VLVYLPQTSGTLVIVKFLSNEKFMQIKDYILYSGGLHSTEIEIDFPENINEISGKILLMFCSGIFENNSYYYVTHYMYYGLKDVILHSGSNPDINFTESDLKPLGNFYNSRFQVNYPSIANAWKMTAFLSFPGFDNSSDVPFYSTFYDNDNLTLPKGLPFQCDLKMLSYYSIGSIYGYHRPHRLKTAPMDTTGTQTTFVISHYVLGQNTPANEEMNVDDNTVFSYSDNLTQGIYVIDLYDTRQHLTSVFTDKKSIRFADLKSRGFAPNPNTQYYWTVSKFTSFSNMDDFLNSNICYRPDFDAISGSDVRSFHTTP
jgi:hypothetical protein